MTHGINTSIDSVVERLSGRIDAVVGSLLPPETPCALLDFPNHANVGDSAIWLGEKEWLGRQGVQLRYVCDTASYSRQRLAASLGDGIILLHGGGNLGDFWIEHQQFREQVIEDFPDNQIVQLPQTIHFLDEWDIGQVQRVFDQHKRLTLLCRDQRSLDFAQTHFQAPSLLCPDMAFSLGNLERPGEPTSNVLYLCRTDAESWGVPLPRTVGVEQTDWLEEAVTPVAERCSVLTRRIDSPGTDWPVLMDSLISAYDDLAAERLLRGCGVLSRGRAVITDRLHGHILCLLLGIPHVLLDNNYGKVRGFYETWTQGDLLASWADSPAEAIELVEGLRTTPGTAAAATAAL